MNHIDSNRANCNLDNLEWLDHKSKGTHNGRSKPVVLIDNDNGTSIPFGYIGECVDYLIKSFNLDVNVDYVRQRISTAANNGKQYLGLNFKFI